MIQIEITETASDATNQEKSTFNKIKIYCETVEQAKKELIERYGKMPSKRKKIYQDKKDGTSIEIGFTHSFWTSDISHNSKKWHQTDWITIWEVTKTPIKL